MTRKTYAKIDLMALQHNLRVAKRHAPKSKVLAMVKANAYGHGIVPCAQALSEADGFGVVCLESALKLRAAGISKTIVLIEGFFDEKELREIEAQQIAVVLHDLSQVEVILSTPLSRPLQVWLKLETGMHCLGLKSREFKLALEKIQQCPWVDKQSVIMSHFASADEQDNPQTLEQIQHFNLHHKASAYLASFAHSAAILSLPETHHDWVRPGIMLYGISPFADRCGFEHGLQPVMTLESRLISIEHLSRGDKVSYGGTWECPEDMRVGIVSIGYGDGYPRHAQPGTPVLLNGIQVPLIGRVCMDLLCVDLRTQPNARPGDRVVLWGEGLPVEIIAKHAGTIGYELLSQVTQRVNFEYSKV